METKISTNQSKVKNYDIKSNDLEYHIELRESKNNSLCLILTKKGISFFLYKAVFTLGELYLISKNFRVFEKIEDLINSLDTIIKNGKISIKEKEENNNEQIELKIKIYSFSGNEEEIILTLTKKVPKEQLYHQIKELEKKIYFLEKENKNKDLEIKKLNDKLDKMENANFINIKSEILINENEINEIRKRILKNRNGKIYLKLLYSLPNDSDSIKNFHDKCDNIKRVLVLIRTIKGIKFGGYTEECFDSSSSYKKDDNAFVFRLNNFKIYNIKKGKNAIFCGENKGPCFIGGDSGFNININGPNILKSSCNTSNAKNNCYDIRIDNELNNNEYYFTIQHLEIFQVLI